jgi:hypothetical protein
MQYTNEAYKRERPRAFVTASRCPREQTFFTLIFLFPSSFSKLLLYNKLGESQQPLEEEEKKRVLETLGKRRRTATQVLTRVTDFDRKWI